MFFMLRRLLSSESKVVMTSLQLYKHLIRQCERLPPDACKYYKFAIKQSYKQHKTESDPERVKEIIQKSIEDAKWIIDKATSDAENPDSSGGLETTNNSLLKPKSEHIRLRVYLIELRE